MVFFLQLAPGFLPPRRAWVPPLAGSGAGRTRVAVHVVGVRRFPRLQGLRPSPSRLDSPAYNRQAGTLAEAPSVWSRGRQGLNLLLLSKQSCGLLAFLQNLLHFTKLLCDLGPLLGLL